MQKINSARMLLTALTTTTIVAAHADAQIMSGDVIVMRRKIETLTLVRTSPTPAATPPTSTPTSTPTPTPTPTTSSAGTATPTPTSTAPARYQKVATTAVLQAPTLPHASTGQTPYSGSISYSTNATGIICRDTTTGQAAVDPAACDELPNPASVGTQTIGAQYQPTYRIVVIDPTQLLATAPSLTNMQAVCAAAAQFAIAGGGSEQWRVSCDPNDIKGAYLLSGTQPVVMGLGDDNYARATSPGGPNYALATPINPYAGVNICRRTADGGVVASANCTTSGKSVTVPGVVNPQTRIVAIAWADVVAAVPDANNQAAFCTSTVPFTAVNDSNQYYGTVTSTGLTYQISCDPDATRMHFQKVSTTVLPAAEMRSATTFSYSSANFQQRVPLDASAAPTCIDTDTGQAASSARVCDNVAFSSPSTGVSVPGTFVPMLQRVLVNWSDVLASYPQATSQNAFCSRTITVDMGSTGSARMTTTCNPDDVRIHYTPTPTSITAIVPTSFSTGKTAAQLGRTADDFDASLPVGKYSSGTKCKDTDTGQTLSSFTMCQYLPASTETQTYNYAMHVSPSTKTVTVKWSDILATSPSGITNKTAFCSTTGINMYYGTDGQTWVSGYHMACS